MSVAVTAELTHAKQTWEDLYAGGHRLSYPNDVFVRVAHRLLDPAVHHEGLEIGFGSGESLVHLARRGHRRPGPDLSGTAVAVTSARLAAAGAAADLHEVSSIDLPFDDAAFDFVVCWQVLTYNTWASLAHAVDEIDRVLRPGGVFLGTLTAPGDFMHTDGEPVGDDLYRLRSTQEDTVVMVVPEPRIAECFPGHDLEIGSFGFTFGGRAAQHWLVSYVR